MTYEEVMQRMLSKVPASIDKREGSLIYTALAPAALEVTNMYIDLGVALKEVFADTATRQYLIKRAAESGVVPESATKAILKGEFNMDVAIGARFSVDTLNYKAIEKMSAGVYKMECETSGAIGNTGIGDLLPIDYIDGLESAKNTEVLVLGQNEEDTEVFRKRYFDNISTKSYGGNVADYKQRTKTIDGVGGVKVYPVWNGGGTVKLVVLNSAYDVPTQTLLDNVKNTMDPAPAGAGKGVAPIGHTVTVVGAVATTVNITNTITYQTGFTWDDVRENVISAIDAYFLELAKEWENQTQLIVRISQIETRLLDISGILDIANTKLNGATVNLMLDKDSIPKRGNHQ